MGMELPRDVRSRSRLVGAVAAMITFFVMCGLLIPNMESGLVVITIFALSGISGVMFAEVVRYRARRRMSEATGQRFEPTAALSLTAWTSVVLSAYAVLVILNTWFLLPADPARTIAANVFIKLKIIGIVAVVLAGLIWVARWSFAKRNLRRVSNHVETSGDT